jgi:hypothetical protein
MKSSLKILNQGDLFNDIHYINYINLNIIEFFTQKVKKFSNINIFLKI